MLSRLGAMSVRYLQAQSWQQWCTMVHYRFLGRNRTVWVTASNQVPALVMRRATSV